MPAPTAGGSSPTRRLRPALLAAMLLLSACTPNRFVSGWIPWWGASAGTQAATDTDGTNLFGEVSLFWYGTRTDGTIGLNTPSSSTTSLNATVAALRAKGLPIVPTIADGTSAGTMSTIIADTTKRTNHITNIVNLVVNNSYDGIDIDYEVFAFSQQAQWSTIKPNWIKFVHELAVALHQRGKLLSITVPAVWNSGNSGYWVYAQPDIAADVDRLRLMVYDWSVSTAGPIAPMWWVNQVIAYSSSVVPVSKLQLGVPAYGRHWVTKKYAADNCPAGSVTRSAVTMRDLAALAAAHSVTPTRDSSGELTFTWTESSLGEFVTSVAPGGWVAPGTVVTATDQPADGLPSRAVRIRSQISKPTCTLIHTVYAPDATSVRQRADAALAAGWSGIVIWALGYETADVYQQLSGVTGQRPGGEPYGAVDTPVVNGSTVTVTGYALDPEYDLPVPVRVTATPVGGSARPTVTQLARTSRDGMPAGVGPFHGFSVAFTLAAGSYTVCASAVQWGGAAGADLGCQNVTV